MSIRNDLAFDPKDLPADTWPPGTAEAFYGLEQTDEPTAKSVAVVGVITSLNPIDGADRIVVATVDCSDAGQWSGVVPISTNLRDQVLVLLQDALLPSDNPRWDFMSKHKFRVRMSRFKGVPSECVILPATERECQLDLGTCRMDALSVTKYSKPLPKEMAGVAKGNFPSFIPRTDEDNFQRVTDYRALMEDAWYATEKADGTSCTAYVDDEGLHVCSRNLELKEFDPEGRGNLYWRMARKYELEFMPSGLAIQFEIVGPGVQSNHMGLADLEIRVFTAMTFNRDTVDYLGPLSYPKLVEMCGNNSLPLARLLCVSRGPLSADDLRDMADIQYSNGKPAEGIVIRAMNSSWSFKVLNLAYKD